MMPTMPLNQGANYPTQGANTNRWSVGRSDRLAHYYIDNSVSCLNIQYLFAVDENDNNEVVIKVLQVLICLTKHGYYDNPDDVKPLLPSIRKLLDGKQDFLSKESKSDDVDSGDDRTC